MKSIKTIILVVVVASSMYSCCTFGLVSVWEHYVTADTGEKTFKIYTIDNSIPVLVAVSDGFYNDRADFAVSIYPGGSEEKFNKKIKICVKELTLDNFDKKTVAQIYMGDITDLNKENACNEYPSNNNRHTVPVFNETDHAWNSKAIIEGVIDIYVDDELMDEVYFKQNLRKISHRPICSFGV